MKCHKALDNREAREKNHKDTKGTKENAIALKMRQGTVGWVERSVTQQVFSRVRLHERDPNLQEPRSHLILWYSYS
ncbi:MAG: hypothetical protein F6K14_33500 [Symploca sp. SIO2C1]|nr:hypothetical protein [Symploca sp. SIO2C1]